MREKKKKKLIILSLIGILFVMSAGYAVFNSNLNIKGTSNITSNWDIKITSVTIDSTSGTGKNVNLDFNNLTANMEADLYEKGDSVTYNVVIENNGTFDAKLDNIEQSIQEENEAVKISFSGYTKGQTLKKNTSQTIKVTIEYNKDYSGEGKGSKEVSITFDYNQNEGGTITPTNDYLLTYDYSTNGGTSSSQGQEYIAEGSNVNLDVTAEKEGYTFLGWNTESNLQVGLQKFTMPSNDTILYALYSKSLIVTFDKDEYTSSVGATSSTCNIYNNETSCTIILPEINTDETVLGWYDGDTLVGQAGSKYTVTKDITLTAKSEISEPIMMSNDGSAFWQSGYIDYITSIEILSKKTVPDNAIEAWDVSEKQNGSVMAYIIDDPDNEGMYKLYIGGNGGVIAPTNSGWLFAEFTNLTSIDLTNLDTSNVADMTGMFSGSSNLTSLDLSAFDTSKVINMSHMFSGCTSLTNLDLSSFDTSNVTDMSYMFYNCTNLTKLSLCNFYTYNVYYMNYMFANTYDLQAVYVGPYWDETLATNNGGTGAMFENSGVSEVTQSGSESCEVEGEKVSVTLAATTTTDTVTAVASAKATSGIANYQFGVITFESYDTEDDDNYTWYDNGDSNVFEYNFSTGSVLASTTLKDTKISSSDYGNDGLYKDKYEKDRYIFRGSDPDNYVTFNDETWRIVSVESDGAIKIVNVDNTGNKAYDTPGPRDYSAGGTYCAFATNGCNAWATNNSYVIHDVYNNTLGGTVLKDSTLNTYLNNTYLNSLDSYDAGTIVSHKWNVGGVDYNDTLTNQIKSEKSETWKGKVGLLSITEYLRLNIDDDCTKFEYLSDSCSKYNWLDYYGASTSFTFTPAVDSDIINATGDTSYIYTIPTTVMPGSYSDIYQAGDNTLTYYPVVYLSPSTVFEGSGTQKDPYTITDNKSTVSIKAKVTSNYENEAESNVVTVDSKIIDPPTFYESGNDVTIIYPEGCGENYKCTYIKDGEEIEVKDSEIVVNFTESGDLVAKVTDGDKFVSSSYTFVINSRTITYDYSTNGGNSASKQTDKISEGTHVDLSPTATKTGYNFVGWNTDKDATSGLSELVAGSKNITLYAIFKDDIKPTVTLSPNSQSNYISGGKAVTVKLADNGSGLKANQTVYYAWSTSNTENPKEFETVTTSNTAGAKSTSVTIPASSSSSLTGVYYLWIKSGIEDVSGNTSRMIVSESFKFDNGTPTVTLSTSATTNTITAVATAQAESGIAKYEFSKDGGETWVDNGTSNAYTFTGLNGADSISISGLKSKVVTSGVGLYKDEYEEGRYTYKGESVNNYINLDYLNMGGEDLWRILSIESDGTLKVVRSTPISIDGDSMLWFDTASRDSAIWGSKTTMLDSSGNHVTSMPKEVGSSTMIDIPDTEAYINEYLNDYFISENISIFGDEDDHEYTSNDEETYQAPAISHYWNVGMGSISEGQSLETDISLEQAYKWKGEVGLVSASEYVRASANEYCSSVYEFNSGSNCVANWRDRRFDESVRSVKNWLSTMTDYKRLVLMTPLGSGFLFDVDYGTLKAVNSYDETTSADGVYYPAVYLSSNIGLLGSGTESDPYTIVEKPTYQIKTRVTSNTNKTATDEKEVTLNSAKTPTFSESGSNVIITYPEGCGSTYTCSYSKDGGSEVTVTSKTATVNFTSSGNVVAKVVDGTDTVSSSYNMVITNPAVSFSPNSQSTYTKSSTVSVKLSSKVGLTSGQTVYYAWSTSNTEEPSFDTSGTTIDATEKTVETCPDGYFSYGSGGDANLCYSRADVTKAIEPTETTVYTCPTGYILNGTKCTSSGTGVTTTNSSGAKSTTVTIPSSSTSSLTGTYYLWIKSGVKDTIGNTSSTKVSGAFKFDNTAPTCKTIGGSDEWSASTQTLKGLCSDANSGCSSSTISKTYSIATSNSGSYNSYYSPGTVTDKAGNTTTCPTAHVKVTGITLKDYEQLGSLFTFDGKTGLSGTIWKNQFGIESNGTLIGAGIGSNCVSFDGIDDYVRIAELNYSSVTLETVYKPTNVTKGHQQLVSNIQKGGYALSISSNGRPEVEAYKSGAYRYATISNVLNNGNIYYLSGRVNNSYQKVYDGKTTVTSYYNASITTTQLNTHMVLGTNPYGNRRDTYTETNETFKGCMYAARMYYTVLSDDQLQKHYVIDKARFGF